MEGGTALASIVRVLLTLVGVCGLAWVVLSLLARRGFLKGGLRGEGRIRVLERVALSPRRQLYLVQADQRLFLLGAGEAGPPALIAELDAGSDLGAQLRAVHSAEAAN